MWCFIFRFSPFWFDPEGLGSPWGGLGTQACIRFYIKVAVVVLLASSLSSLCVAFCLRMFLVLDSSESVSSLHYIIRSWPHQVDCSILKPLKGECYQRYFCSFLLSVIHLSFIAWHSRILKKINNLHRVDKYFVHYIWIWKNVSL